jgi:hypothetical protein
MGPPPPFPGVENDEDRLMYSSTIIPPLRRARRGRRDRLIPDWSAVFDHRQLDDAYDEPEFDFDRDVNWDDYEVPQDELQDFDDLPRARRAASPVELSRAEASTHVNTAADVEGVLQDEEADADKDDRTANDAEECPHDVPVTAAGDAAYEVPVDATHGHGSD